MNTIVSTLYDAIPFYIASIPIIILNLYAISKKRRILNAKYKFIEKLFTLGFILTLLFILSVTIGTTFGIKIENVNWKNININPLEEIYIQYVLTLNGDTHALINLFGNILLFIPWGFFLAIYCKKIKNEKYKILIIGILTSFLIETIQLFIGRYADITDIILNTIGVLLGRLIFCYFNILFEEFFNKINLRYPNNNKEVKAFNMVQIISCFIFLVASILR